MVRWAFRLVFSALVEASFLQRMLVASFYDGLEGRTVPKGRAVSGPTASRQSHAYALLVAESKRGPDSIEQVGLCELQIQPLGNLRDAPYLSGLIVSPANRRTGVARALIASCESLATR